MVTPWQSVVVVAVFLRQLSYFSSMEITLYVRHDNFTSRHGLLQDAVD